MQHVLSGVAPSQTFIPFLSLLSEKHSQSMYNTYGQQIKFVAKTVHWRNGALQPQAAKTARIPELVVLPKAPNGHIRLECMGGGEGSCKGGLSLPFPLCCKDSGSSSGVRPAPRASLSTCCVKESPSKTTSLLPPPAPPRILFGTLPRNDAVSCSRGFWENNCVSGWPSGGPLYLPSQD